MKAKMVVAVVSGGPDSVCSLVYWLSRGYNSVVLFYNYGQKAFTRELEAVKSILNELSKIASERKWGLVEELRVVDLSFMKSMWRGTQLVDESVKVKKEYEKTVVVPLRNLVMTVIAAAYAYNMVEQGLCSEVVIVLGSQYDDVKPREDTWEPRYPDCTPECYTVLETAFEVCHFRSTRSKVKVWTPSMVMMRKSELLKTCYELVGDLIYKTWSCYEGFDRHCGTCESCINRKTAFRESGIPDKTEYIVP